ncbi:WXG100 family type VII secretion target [Streptomyces sp. GQFP]|uniref:WXG100 family type VII secretion target n=1 Tax=Streptomyces sp. GQFP TaxID=2907545 RepID=UPI001F1EA70B|nr:WXG100 family type VII secretion target [Streptomyces sp. GQFP]UIX32001.1 WXG100 family type VII secretion target [Streptomyces sp. GQFP]
MSDTSDGIIHVEYNPVYNAAEDMVQQTRAIAGTLSNLEMELSELKETWFGGDAQVYEEKQAEWDAAVLTMEQLLIKHSDLLIDVSDNYKYTENYLSQLWSEVSIGR